jgi:putative ABC transport system substrate-binding protein
LRLDHLATHAAEVVDARVDVEQRTKLELAVNLKTAKALGIAIPPAVLARADRVVE